MRQPDTFERAIVGCLITLPVDQARAVALASGKELLHTPLYSFMFEVLAPPAMSQTPLGKATAAAAIMRTPGYTEHFGAHDGAVESVIDLCVEAASPDQSWQFYVQELKLAHTRRVLMAALDEAALDAAAATSIEQASSIALAKVVDAANRLRPISYEDDESCIETVAASFIQQYQCGDVSLPFPQPKLNTVGGARPGDIVIVSAYTGVGKSWIGLDWCVTWARMGKRVRYYSLEMPSGQLLERVLAMDHEIDLEKVIRRQIPTSHVANCLGVIQRHPIDILDGGWTPDRLMTNTLTAQHKPDVIIVDHWHLMEIEGKDMRIGMNAALSRLKAFAVEQGIIIILLAQLTRPEKRQGATPEPSIYMLRESGAIEQIADYCIFLHRKIDDAGREVYTMWTEKQRQGLPAGKFEVRFNGYRFR